MQEDTAVIGIIVSVAPGCLVSEFGATVRTQSVLAVDILSTVQ